MENNKQAVLSIRVTDCKGADPVCYKWEGGNASFQTNPVAVEKLWRELLLYFYKMNLLRFSWKLPSYTIAGHLLGSYQHLHAQKKMISEELNFTNKKTIWGVLTFFSFSDLWCDVKAATSLCKPGHCFESAFFRKLFICF